MGNPKLSKVAWAVVFEQSFAQVWIAAETALTENSENFANLVAAVEQSQTAADDREQLSALRQRSVPRGVAANRGAGPEPIPRIVICQSGDQIWVFGGALGSPLPPGGSLAIPVSALPADVQVPTRGLPLPHPTDPVALQRKVMRRLWFAGSERTGEPAFVLRCMLAVGGGTFESSFRQGIVSETTLNADSPAACSAAPPTRQQVRRGGGGRVGTGWRRCITASITTTSPPPSPPPK